MISSDISGSLLTLFSIIAILLLGPLNTYFTSDIVLSSSKTAIHLVLFYSFYFSPEIYLSVPFKSFYSYYRAWLKLL